jgi:hypothetical protein
MKLYCKDCHYYLGVVSVAPEGDWKPWCEVYGTYPQIQKNKDLKCVYYRRKWWKFWA